MSKLSKETHTRLVREVKQAQIWLNPLIGLKRIKYKNRIFEYEVPKWSIETYTRLIIGVKQEQIRLNLLIGLKGIKAD